MGEDGEVIPIDPDLDPADLSEPSLRPRAAVSQPSLRRAQPAVLVAIAVGGMLGATARFELAEALPATPGHFPWATFWTNLSGSFLLGFALVLLLERFPPTRLVRPFIATGILGAFTTMSTYQVETVLLVKDGHPGTAILYGLGSVAAGLGLAYAGLHTGRLAAVRRPQAQL